jgi:hypothetical protein
MNFWTNTKVCLAFAEFTSKKITALAKACYCIASSDGAMAEQPNLDLKFRGSNPADDNTGRILQKEKNAFANLSIIKLL